MRYLQGHLIYLRYFKKTYLYLPCISNRLFTSQFGRAKGEYPKTVMIKTWKSGNADSFTLVLASLIIILMFKVSWVKIVKLKCQC